MNFSSMNTQQTIKQLCPGTRVHREVSPDPVPKGLLSSEVLGFVGQIAAPYVHGIEIDELRFGTDKVTTPAGIRFTVTGLRKIVSALRELGFNPDADALARHAGIAPPFARPTRGISHVGRREKAVGEGGPQVLELTEQCELVAYRALHAPLMGLLERVIASHGDAADLELVALQHSLAGLARPPFSTSAEEVILRVVRNNRIADFGR